MFKQRKHKTFNYQPRFSKENETDSDVEEGSTKDFVSRWKRERGTKTKMGLSMSIRTLILVLVLLLICMYILDSKFK
ncbi:hypothetical protein [Hwangdonia lutea]|uniref:Uncharacterized protein n=1 Tax=Hwangdonia lutea TaxID=3075823 RepID=A0AA97EJR0_9FLAO|nr:hypothetical protein [Hwangdonia sp. SCSIO 19198]WOD42714.1 hypothetical protein RNZ46_12020 [Hwangdonia sp. SCSIO 19198]